MRVKSVAVREIFDSRAQSTLELGLAGSDGRMFLAQIASGKSRGKNEARVFGIQKAKAALRRAEGKLAGRKFKSVSDFDNYLLTLDKTADKRELGGNVLLGLSAAFTRALAFERRKEPWQTINREFFGGRRQLRKPLIFSNFINGGAHARNSLDIQEYLVVARVKQSVTETVKKLISFYGTVGEYLRQLYRLKNLAIGDESGYALDFRDNYEPIRVLERLIRMSRLQSEFRLGLDAAASSFYRKPYYQFEGRKQNTKKLLDVYLGYFSHSKLLYSIEDPFAEKDYAGFKMLSSKSEGRLVVGDDLTTTNAQAIRRFAAAGLINGVIIKPNQIGTVTETCQAIQAAKDKNLKFIISHRSGETEDNFIIHLARGSGADGVKIGAPLRERIYKFNELIRVYDN